MCSHLFPFMQKGIRTAFQKTLGVYKCFWNIHEIWFCHCRSVFERQIMLHLLISAYFSNSRYVIVLSKISLKIISLSERNNNSKFLEVIPKQCRDFLKKLLLTFKNLCLKKKKKKVHLSYTGVYKGKIPSQNEAEMKTPVIWNLIFQCTTIRFT